MPDIVVTVPKTFRYGDNQPGLASWVAEGDNAGDPGSWEHDDDQGYVFTTYGGKPDITPGDRVYVVCEYRLRGYAPLIDCRCEGGRIHLIRGGGHTAVAVTIPERIVGFRGWRYRWWDRSVEVPFPDWTN